MSKDVLNKPLLNIAVVEDEPQFQEMLKTYITRFSQEHGTPIHLTIYSTGTDFLDDFHDQFSLVLLDVVMPGSTGFDVAHTIRQMQSRVCLVFITSMAQYAIRGYEVDAVDYILKPLEYEVFSNKFTRILRNVHTDNKFPIENGAEITYISLSDVSYIESDKHYVIWHCEGGNVRTRHTVRSLASQLEKYGFALIRTSLLINISCVVRSTPDTVWVQTPQAQGESTIEALPIARSFRSSFRDQMARFISQSS
ncbi:LytR/AlgR family response regulator transcription factor [Alloscardovia omnicolens]|uniref:LytR/AlgR family response regulator transcription factor n=1 Tax=Alloscardovia omnicolens TaxID=419015 RepID=UPI003A69B2BA